MARYKKIDRGMAVAGTRMPKVEGPCFPITTSPEAATLLYT
jgi:hypothetical protein